MKTISAFVIKSFALFEPEKEKVRSRALNSQERYLLDWSLKSDSNPVKVRRRRKRQTLILFDKLHESEAAP